MIRDSYLKQIVELLDNIRFSGENGLDNTSRKHGAAYETV